MKMTPVHYNMLREKVYTYLNAHPDYPTEADYARKGLSAMRWRWEIYWASGGGVLSSGGMFGPYGYLNDEHIDTALRQILARYHRGADPRIIEVNPRYKIFVVNDKPRTVEGFMIRYPGEFAQYKFFITRHPGTYGLEADPRPPHKLKGKYVVTEVSTGLSVLGAFDNPEEAAFKVGEKLREVGAARFAEIMELQKRAGRSFKRTNPLPAALTMRLADKAMALHAGDVAGTVAWLKMLGAHDIYLPAGEREAALTGPSGIRVGIVPSDPVTCAVQLGFAVAGTFWPQAFPDLLEEVKRRWKMERLQSRIGGKRP